jgi:hypothetical protein
MFYDDKGERIMNQSATARADDSRHQHQHRGQREERAASHIAASTHTHTRRPGRRATTTQDGH